MKNGHSQNEIRVNISLTIVMDTIIPILTSTIITRAIMIPMRIIMQAVPAVAAALTITAVTVIRMGREVTPIRITRTKKHLNYRSS